MDSRIYFTLGDLAANITTGIVVALAICLMVGPSWNMLIAMFIAMALGMALALPVSIPFLYFFGAMEVMVPTMLTGMVSGMVVGMWGAMEAITYSRAAIAGAVSGLVTINGVWLANLQLSGPRNGGVERGEHHG